MKKICVYCGSNNGARPEYTNSAERLARALADRGIGLVYGGASVGIMGAVADAVLAAGGEVIGVIPRGLFTREVAHNELTRLHVVDSMHQRKALMADLADGFIALPGGLGTLEELFEILTWAQLGMHEKPCGLLNVSHYYDGLIQFIEHAAAERFIKPSHKNLLLIDNDPDTLLARFSAYQPPQMRQWLDRDTI